MTPFIWLDTPITKVFDFYKSIFERVQIHSVSDFTGVIEIDGQKLIFMNGGPYHKLTPAFSLMIECDTQAEVDYYWNKLTSNGKEGRCGWCIDQFGVSFQIIPKILPRLLGHENREITKQARDKMMVMNKIIIADLPPFVLS